MALQEKEELPGVVSESHDRIGWNRRRVLVNWM